MTTGARAEMAGVESALAKFDYFELKVYDIHGYSKGRLVSRSRMRDVMRQGMGLHAAICFYGVRGQPNLHTALTRNHRVTPVLSTLRQSQRAAYGERRVGSVLCEVRYPDNTLDTRTPREVTLAVLQQLGTEFGLKILSSFEAEFGVTDATTLKPLAHENRWASLTVLKNGHGPLMGLTEVMREIGVHIDTLMSEFGRGQFEVTFDIAEGIEAADMATDFKLESYVYLKDKGYNAEFMTCVNPDSGCRNGFHFNFSLWDFEGANVFVNTSQGKQLSDFGQHFLAGLVEHASALTAFCSPTINCYRRVGTAFAPTYANWAWENRDSTFRVKLEAEANVYIENRLPSSACNPHLVLASTLAAGLDGVRRNLTLPDPMEQTTRLPSTLDEALSALEADKHLTQALGQNFVDLFIYTKRQFECEEFKSFVELSPEEHLLKEKEYYYDPL
ncbi:hypothetical protein RRG08_015568 [Elysia crispata]|uniref:Lengsin n=1 Tax=Elysia crispata TaxID=231223 RepID=A0AAE0YJA7_9GAST|nr:hypothetical protein RRG08_015568 [Elysia crispata]